MNANELRIGNYVDGGIVQSLPMHQGEMYAVLNKSEFHSFGTPTLMEDIKPIPLTKEWYCKINEQLSNIGFKYSHSEITNRLFIYIGITTVQCKLFCFY